MVILVGKTSHDRSTSAGCSTSSTLSAGTGAHISVGLDVYSSSLQPLQTVRYIYPEGSPVTIIAPGGGTVYQLLTTPGVIATSTTDGSVTGYFRNPVAFPIVHFSGDGKTMVLAVSGDGTATIEVVRFQ